MALDAFNFGNQETWWLFAWLDKCSQFDLKAECVAAMDEGMEGPLTNAPGATASYAAIEPLSKRLFRYFENLIANWCVAHDIKLGDGGEYFLTTMESNERPLPPNDSEHLSVNDLLFVSMIGSTLHRVNWWRLAEAVMVHHGLWNPPKWPR